MGSKLSVEDVMANLEARAAFHREQEAHHRDQEAFHVQQTAYHREQQAFHRTAQEKALKDLETFRTVVGSAGAQPLPQEEEPEVPAPGRKRFGRMVMLAAESPDLPEPFGPTAAAEEATRRFAEHLSGPIRPRTASDALRRMLAEGRLELVRKGTAKREALYKRPGPERAKKHP
ncbi:MAG TPA: hypothetical protein VGX68_08420 [Thermoanaerobaculia bacterium]|nr:hypothetical protein [Thermoanaerobaculia bacterium]